MIEYFAGMAKPVLLTILIKKRKCKMTKVDLITGFLGSGKTTFIRKYAGYLINKGQHIGIIENDFGAVNVDMMLLNDLEGENCELEMVSGGCDADCHLRRFKTKLIALGMQGLDRVIIEPSGIYDVDEFFDALCEEPLDRFYEIGSVITIADAGLNDSNSEETEYMLASQLSAAGCVVFSKITESDDEKINRMRTYINDVLKKCGCDRVLDKEIISKKFDDFTPDDFAFMADSGYESHSMEKRNYVENGSFGSLYYMNLKIDEDSLRKVSEKLFSDKSFGSVFRIKGFFTDESGSWKEINATGDNIQISPIKEGQYVIIVIGEGLKADKINEIFGGFA